MNSKILREIGLTDYETKIYLTLLKNKQLSAYELAEKAGLYRQVTYDTLKRLEEKGFVNSIVEGKTKKFNALDPDLVLEILNEKTEQYRSLLPELNKIYDSSHDSLTVETYKGENITRIALRDIINHLKEKGGEVLATSVDESIPLSNYKSTTEQYERDLIYYKINERVIIKEGTKGLFKKGTSKYKKIPEKFFNPNPTQIYGDNVQIIIWGNPDYLIIIRSKAVADSYRKHFELLWHLAKK